MRVLVAEDDEGLGEVLARGLREQGYVVDLVPDGEAAAAYLRFYQYEVVVLDWRMPRLSGFDLVQRLRRGGTATPVLMLTARDTPADRIAGLDAGADDYLVKPFDFGELLARIRALQRRPPVSQAPWIKIGDVEFDPAAREVLVRGQRPAFTSTELGILEILMRRSPGVADRRSIAQHVWDNEADAFGSNTIDVHLARLRSKLAGGGVRIETVRGVGYRISPAEHESQRVQPRRPGRRRRHGGHRGGLRHRRAHVQPGGRPAHDPAEGRPARRPPHGRAAPSGHARAAGGAQRREQRPRRRRPPRCSSGR